MTPLGTTVTTTVHSIGGRSEVVSGEVIGHRRSSLIVKTVAHGNIVVPLDKLEPPTTLTPRPAQGAGWYGS